MAGAAQIGNLQVRLGIDTAQFSAGVATAQSRLGQLSKSLKAFAIGAAGALSLGAVAASLRNVTGHMDDLGKAAQKIGIPVEELSKLEYAARLADVSLEQLSGSVGKFSKGLAELQSTGKGSVAEAMQALGISAKDAQGNLRPTLDIIGDIAARFSVMQDGAGKTAIAMALFGKSGAEIIPLLNGGREAIAAAGDELQRFGGVVTEQTSVAAEAFNDNLTRLQAAGEGLAQQVTTALLPSLVGLTEELLRLVEQVPVAEWVQSVTDWFSQLAPYIETTRKEFELLAGVLERIGLVDSGVGANKNSVQSILDSIDNFGSQAAAPGKGSLPSDRRKEAAPILPSLGGSTAKPPRYMDPGYTSISPSQEGDLAAETSYLTKQFEDAQDAAQDLASSITDTLGNALLGLADGTLSFKDAFADMAQGLMSDLSDITAQLLKSGLLQLLGSLGTQYGGAQGLLGGFGGFYALGGFLGAGKWGIAGEAGPEIVKGPASIMPMGQGGGGTTVNVINQGGGDVQQRKRRDGSGREIVDIIIGVTRQEQARGSKRLLGAGYGVNPALVQR